MSYLDHAKARRGCESMLKALIVAGADKDLLNKVSSVMMVATNDNPILLKDGYTPLMEAAREGHEGCVRLLVEAGANRSHWLRLTCGETQSALSLAKTEAIKAILCS